LNILITEENESDFDQVWNLNIKAFGREDEAKLVNILRYSGISYISLTAKRNNKILGHILFTPVKLIGNNKNLKIMGLGPMAVNPGYQRQGIGTKLIIAGIEACKNEGYDAVVVLGHPEYYPKFGFVQSSNYGISCEYDAPTEAFMILELTKGVLKGKSGIIKYNNAFNTV